MTAEEIKKVREAEEKAFTEAETKRKEFMEVHTSHLFIPLPIPCIVAPLV